MNTRIRRLTAINYFGGKSRHLDWILPLIPEHHSYLEPFCGSAAVFLNKQPAKVECINDKDGRLINFFRILREKPDQLIGLLEITPYSREEFNLACLQSEDPVEEARRFFVRALQSFGGITHNIRRMNSYRIDVQQTRNGMAGCVSKFLTKIDNLHEVTQRLRETMIDNRDAFYLINKFNFANCFIYQDPPYRHETRTSSNDYLYEMSHNQHVQLAEVNNRSASMIMISHYNEPFYDELYPYPTWLKILGPERKSNLGKGVINREAVWVNYWKRKGFLELVHGSPLLTVKFNS